MIALLKSPTQARRLLEPLRHANTDLPTNTGGIPVQISQISKCLFKGSIFKKPAAYIGCLTRPVHGKGPGWVGSTIFVALILLSVLGLSTTIY